MELFCSVFEKDVLVWTVDFTIEIQLRFKLIHPCVEGVQV